MTTPEENTAAQPPVDADLIPAVSGTDAEMVEQVKTGIATGIITTVDAGDSVSLTTAGIGVSASVSLGTGTSIGATHFNDAVGYVITEPRLRDDEIEEVVRLANAMGDLTLMPTEVKGKEDDLRRYLHSLNRRVG